MKFYLLLFLLPSLSQATLPEPVTSTGTCYEIHAGKEILGSVLEIKKFENNIHSNISFTQIDSKTKKPIHRFQILKSESDEHFIPLQSAFEIYDNNKMVKSRVSTFEVKKDLIHVKTKDSTSKKPIMFEEPKGLVLTQQMSDLLFTRKSLTDIKPNEKLAFQTFSESEGKVQQVISHLEGQSDHLILVHQIEGQIYKTKHASDGSLISSHDVTKNVELKPCSSNSVFTHLNSALSYKPFKSLFSSEDREKIKKCCQHF